jgi:hypothetical protein
LRGPTGIDGDLVVYSGSGSIHSLVVVVVVVVVKVVQSVSTVNDGDCEREVDIDIGRERKSDGRGLIRGWIPLGRPPQ